jgi:hypothetical protein
MDKSYQDKYIYYKKKYVDAKYNYDFLIYHSVTPPGIEKILKILDDGYIKLGTDVDEKYRVYTGANGTNYIFCNIYFPDIKNMSYWWTFTNGVGLILHPKLLYNNGAIFNKGWQGGPYTTKNNGFVIDKNDNYKTKRRTLMKIKKWLKNPHDIKEILQKNEHMNHEIIFNKQIPIKYIIGIVCVNCDQKELDAIKNKAIKNKAIEKNLNIPVYTDATKMNLSSFNIKKYNTI